MVTELFCINYKKKNWLLGFNINFQLLYIFYPACSKLRASKFKLSRSGI